jgi:hypothetical protein
MKRALLPLLLAAATLGLIALIAAQVPFANGPSEWKWPYRPPGLEMLGLVLAATLMIPLVYWAAHDKETDWRWALPLLIILGWVLPLDVAQGQPGGFRRTFDLLASRHTFGYVFDAGLAPDTRTLLAEWPTVSAGLNQHSRTHPPGPLLAVRALDLAGRRLADREGERGLVTFAAESLQRESGRAANRGRRVPQALAAPGTLVLLSFLLPLLSALSAWPLHRLAVRLGFSPGAALLAVAFWLTVPARSVFTPSLDQALPLPLLGAAALAAGGGRVRAILAGALLALCVFFSYGYLAAVPLVGLLALTGGETGRFSWRPDRARILRGLLLAAGFVLPWIVLALATGYDPVASFQAAMAQHRSIAVATRSYATWLAWNPWDLLLLLGPVVLGLAALDLRRRDDERPVAHAALAWGWWALLLLLLVSGSVRGEVGRIWLFLMPFACLLAAGAAGRRWGPRGAWTGVLLVAELGLTLALAANMVFVG